MPAEAVKPVSLRIFALIMVAISVALAIPWMFSVTSRYASSSDNGSMISVCSAKTVRMCFEISL